MSDTIIGQPLIVLVNAVDKYMGCEKLFAL